MKKIQKRVIAGIVFLCLAVGMLYRVNEIFRLKGDSAGYPMEMFYEQEPGTVDVLNLGSSHMFANVNPAVLWDEYGIASYNLGAGLQPPWNTYYYLKEALEYQTPELIVMDVFGVVQYSDYIVGDRVAMNTVGLRWGQNYVNNIEISVADEAEYVDYFLQFPLYHTRYDSITVSDFLPYGGDVNGPNYKGYPLNCISTTPIGDFTDVEKVTEVKEMTAKCYEYLTKTIELAKESDIPILLVVNPYSGIMYEEKKVYNHVEQIAEEYGVDYIDFNEYCRNIGFDPQKDFAESHHLNYYGSEKFSSYYGNYIREHYGIADHRGEAGYESWEANSEFYRKQAANVDLAKTETEVEYIEKLFANQERYTICLSFQGDFYQEERGYIYGLADQGLDVWNDYLWIIRNGEVIYRAGRSAEPPDYYMDLGACAAVVSEGDMFLGEAAADVVGSGLNIVVYDNELGKMVDVCGIGAYDEGRISRSEE